MCFQSEKWLLLNTVYWVDFLFIIVVNAYIIEFLTWLNKGYKSRAS